MNAVYGKITRNDVRVAARKSRAGVNNICLTCLLAVMFARIYGKKIWVSHDNAWEDTPRSPLIPLTEQARELINTFDNNYKRSNIDKLYKQLKAAHPGKIQLTV